MASTRMGYGFALTTSVCYGLVPVLAKYGLARAHFLTGITIALTTGTALYVVLLIGSGKWRRWDTLTLKGVGYLLLYAGTNVCAIVANYAAISKSLVSVVAPISATYPAFTLLFSALLLRRVEVISFRILMGTAAIIAGTVLVAR